jgi:ketosteroid isomerase-like protein
MTRRLVLLLAFAIAGSLPAEDPATDAVRAAAEGWRDALMRQDKAALDRLIADDLVYTHAGGKTQNKAEYIESVTTGPSRYESFTDSDTKIRVYGDVAILTGNVDVKLVGRDIYRVRTLEIYKKNNGQWQFAVKEGVRVPKPER